MQSSCKYVFVFHFTQPFLMNVSNQFLLHSAILEERKLLTT